MSNFISRIVLATTFALAGGAAYADSTTAQVHERAMGAGKDHAQARGAGEAGTSPRLVEKARRHAAAMNAGKDHYAALDATR